MAMDMVLWKMKSSFNATDGAVFKEFVRSSLSKKIAAQQEVAIADAVAKAKAIPAPSGLFGRLL